MLLLLCCFICLFVCLFVVVVFVSFILVLGCFFLFVVVFSN